MCPQIGTRLIQSKSHNVIALRPGIFYYINRMISIIDDFYLVVFIKWANKINNNFIERLSLYNYLDKCDGTVEIWSECVEVSPYPLGWQRVLDDVRRLNFNRLCVGKASFLAILRDDVFEVDRGTFRFV